MKHTTTPMLALAMTAMLALSGCMGAAEDQLGLASEDGEDNLAVTLAATNASDEIAHVGAALEDVYAHDAGAASSEGYYNLSLENERADIVANGETSEVTLASGSVPAGSYDQVMLRTSSVQAHGAAAMGDHGGHGDHEDGADGHDHGSEDEHADDDGHDNASEEKSGKANLAVTTDAVDLPVDVDFEVPEDAAAEVRITLDVGASTTADTFSPVFEVTVLEDGETQTTTEASLDAELSGEGDSVTETATPRPAARMTVFGPSGDQLYEPSFEVEQDTFVNSVADGIPAGEEIQLGASESEAVADGATLESYEWDFGDGESAEGQTVRHAYDEPGVYEPTLTVTDSNDVSNQHTLRLVVTGVTTTVADASFEEDAQGWTAGSASLADGAPPLMVWQRDGPGFDGETAWHVDHLASDTLDDPGYMPGFSVTLASANYTIPDDMLKAGFSVAVDGNSSTGSLEVAYTVGEETSSVTTVQPTDGWITIDQPEALNEHAGEEIQFEFTFSSFVDGGVHGGPGFAVDAFELAGLSEADMVNAHLLEEAGGGHDHEGHSH